MIDTANMPTPGIPDDPSSNETYRFGETLLKRAKLVAQTITERVRLAMNRTRSNTDSSGGPDRASGPSN